MQKVYSWYTQQDTKEDTIQSINLNERGRLLDKSSKIPKNCISENCKSMINENVESFLLRLHPAGKIFHIRTIGDATYVKPAKLSEYEQIVLTENCTKDHYILEYCKAIFSL